MKWVEIENVKVVKSTANAGLFRLPDGTEHWIPWSQIDEGSVDRDGGVGTLVCSKWIAQQKGIE